MKASLQHDAIISLIPDRSEDEPTSDNGVGRCYSWDHILNDPLCQLPSDTLDLELVRSFRSDFVQPLDMVGVIGIELLLCDLSGKDPASQCMGSVPLKTFGHSRTEAHSIQCSGSRGVLAIVHIGYAVAGVIKDICQVSNKVTVLRR